MKNKAQNFQVGDKIIVTNPFGHESVETIKEIFNKNKVKTSTGAIVDKKAVKKINKPM